MPGHIVVVGSINMDLVVRAPRHPEPGETILGNNFQTFSGGKGANQAVATARLGGQVKMIGRVGSDAFGESLLASLQKDGVDTQFIQRTSNIASGVALITVSEIGQNTIVVAPGANGKLSPADIRAARPALESAEAVLLQLEIPFETVWETVNLAKQLGVKVILNPAPARTLPSDLLNKIDYMIPNESELGLLTGMEGIAMAAGSLRSIGVKRLVVTLGSEGVLLLDDSDTLKIDSYTVPVVDTTAAGDAFVGAFAVALTEGHTILEAATWGNAAGALAVTAAGAQPSLPNRTQLEDFLKTHPVVIQD